MVPLPGYDALGRRVILGRLGAWDPSKLNPEELFRAASMLFDAMFLDDEQTSVTGELSTQCSLMMNKRLSLVSSRLNVPR